MNDWNERDFFQPQYFTDVINALQQRTPLCADASVGTSVQIGNWIVDRVDQVLAAYSHLNQLPPIADLAIQAFEQAVERYPDEVTRHFRNHAGSRAFRGLFSTRNLDVYSMWARIAKRTHSTWHSEEIWLNKLACTLLRDSTFATKLDEATECCRLGMNRHDTLARIEHHHRAMDSANTSAKSLLMLDLL